MKEAYVQKMVKVFNEHDRWSLISLSNNSGKNLELKFVSALRRQFEFSVDSFQIILDRLLESYMQQDSQHKMNTVDLMDQPAESPSLHNQTSAADTEKSTGRDLFSKEEAQISRTQRDEVREKESQTEFSQQTKHLSPMKDSTQEKNNKDKTPPDLNEVSEHIANLKETDQASLNLLSEEKQTSESAEPPAQTELEHEPELLDKTKCSTEVEQSEQSKPCDGQQAEHLNHRELSVQEELAVHTKPPDEQKELTEQMGQSETPETSDKTQGECLIHTEEPHRAEQADKTDLSECFADDQKSNEEDKAQHVSAPDSSTSSNETQLADERDDGAKTSEEMQEERKTDTEKSESTEEIQALEAEHVEDTQGTDCSCSTSSIQTLCTTQDTLEIHSTQQTGNSEKTPNTLDEVSASDTQDILPASPSLVSDKKTSSSASCKASERLSHMVVLKHSSPKPPRRMCRKVTPSLNPSPVSDSELAVASCLDPHPCPALDYGKDFNLKPNPTADPATCVSDKTNSGSESNPLSDLSSNLDLDLTSDPDPAPSTISTSAVDPTSSFPQESSTLPLPSSQLNADDSSGGQSLKETPTTLDFDEQNLSSPRETVSAPKQLEPLDSVDALVSQTDTSNSDPQEPVYTSEAELSDEAENTTQQQTKNVDVDQPETTLSSPSSSQCATRPVSCVTPPVSCLTPPILSLSPPCFTPSPPSLSPPPCLTPPSHCLSSPMLNTVSPATSFSSPPLSFSPTSSCLSSPPYLTPPMLSLSPPPLCLTPPSPCLSPPLLCLTPPVDSEDLVPQVSPDMEPLILNTDTDEQIKGPPPQPGVPLLQVEDKKEQDYISSLPEVAEPVSFPITIPNSTSHVLPNSQSGGPGDSVPLETVEASSSASVITEAPKVTTDKSEQCDAPQASGSVPAVEVLAESMYGDFEAAMDHLRYRLIATRNPEEIRGGGLLKYSNLLVRDYRPASETQIKTLERYMCSRFFIDFPDVQEQQRKILSYLKNHFIGEERSKYQYLMTLRRVVDDSTVCLMGHERRQTLNMITVLALKVLGEQNIIPNTDHVTCFYQPAPYLAEHSAPYLAEPSYCSYYIPQGGSTLLYQPYPLHLHPQTGLV